MNDEIKEILDRLDFEEWEVDLYKVPITWCELYDIRDYITNLQKENEDYKSRVEKAVEYIKENATSNYFDGKINMFRREVDLLNILQNRSDDNVKD